MKNLLNKEKIIRKIIENEKKRSLSKLSRLLKYPKKTFFYYLLATMSHIKPFKKTFKTLWDTQMISYLPEGNTFYYYGFCEANLTNFLLRYLKNGDVFIDVGAHIGFYSTLSSKLVGNNGKVYSFEPTPRTFEILQKNCDGLDNVELFNFALSDKNDLLSFFDYGPGYSAYNSGHINGAAMIDKKDKKIKVKTTTLNYLILQKKIKPTFIKLDAEGFEYNILKGMNSIFENMNRPLITLEVAGDKQWKENYDKSIEFLLNKSYIVFEININGFIRQHQIQPTYKYDNLLFVPKENLENIIYLYDNN